MSIIIGIVVGTITGAAIGFCLDFISFITEIVTCSVGGGEPTSLIIPLAIIGAIIGGIIGIFSFIQEAKAVTQQAELERIQVEQNMKDAKFNEWYNRLIHYFENITDNLSCGKLYT